MTDRVILAYSGGLDTTVAIPYLKQMTGGEVIAVSIDLGQGGEDMESVRQRAIGAGAVESIVVDARDEFADDYCLPTIKANGMYMKQYPLVSAISRPLIVKHLESVRRRANEAGIGDRLAVLGVTLDPSFDTPAVLRAYGQSVLAGPDAFDQWTLATGRPAQISDLASFFGVDYRDLVGEILDSIEHGLEEDGSRGSLQPEEMQVRVFFFCFVSVLASWLVFADR